MCAPCAARGRSETSVGVFTRLSRDPIRMDSARMRNQHFRQIRCVVSRSIATNGGSPADIIVNRFCVSYRFFSRFSTFNCPKGYCYHHKHTVLSTCIPRDAMQQAFSIFSCAWFLSTFYYVLSSIHINLRPIHQIKAVGETERTVRKMIGWLVDQMMLVRFNSLALI